MLPETTWLPLQLSSSSGETIEARVELAADMPWFQGHFPGNPIFPGIGLLALVEGALRQGAGLSESEWPLASLKRVRFRRALRPGAALRVRLQVARREDELQASFSLHVGKEDVGRGVLLLGRAALTGPPIQDKNHPVGESDA